MSESTGKSEIKGTLSILVTKCWILAVSITFLFAAYPISNRATRIGIILGISVGWASFLAFCWRNKRLRYLVLALPVIFVGLLFCPGKFPSAAKLREDYSHELQSLSEVRYVWGGENRLGVDCSGLIRRALISALTHHGVSHLSGSSLRLAATVWWTDCSAMAMRDGFRGWTRKLFTAPKIDLMDHDKIQTGDLAVTSDGIHVLAYLGNRKWIEADPSVGKVVSLTVPSNNQWLVQPMVLVRWKWMDEINPSSL